MVILVDDLTIVIALVFLTATLTICGIYWIVFFSRQEQRIINRRLDVPAGPRDRDRLRAMGDGAGLLPAGPGALGPRRPVRRTHRAADPVRPIAPRDRRAGKALVLARGVRRGGAV